MWKLLIASVGATMILTGVEAYAGNTDIKTYCKFQILKGGGPNDDMDYKKGGKVVMIKGQSSLQKNRTFDTCGSVKKTANAPSNATGILQKVVDLASLVCDPHEKNKSYGSYVYNTCKNSINPTTEADMDVYIIVSGHNVYVTSSTVACSTLPQDLRPSGCS